MKLMKFAMKRYPISGPQYPPMASSFWKQTLLEYEVELLDDKFTCCTLVEEIISYWSLLNSKICSWYRQAYIFIYDDLTANATFCKQK